MSAHSEHTWKRTTIVASVKWTANEKGNSVWVANFTDEESMQRFMQQPAVKVLSVTLRNDPYKVLDE